MARQDVARNTQPEQPPGVPLYGAHYGQPGYQMPPAQSYGQPTHALHEYNQQGYPIAYQQQHPIGQQYPQQQQHYAPFQPPPQQSAPFGDHQPTQQPGFWTTSDQPDVDWGIPPDKLITDDMDVSIRHGFIRKVYGILFVQLSITFGMALVFNLSKPAGDWLFHNPWLMWVAMGVALVTIIVLTCVPGMARKHPWNMIFLVLLSIAFGITLGYACAAVSTGAFAIAAGITAGVALAVSLFACQTKYDFTGCGVFIMVTMLILMIFGIVMIFIHDRIAQLVYASLGALLFSFYMIYDTQQIVGGKHRKFQYSIDDYVFGALTLYLDIINLFMFILQIVTAANR